MCIISCISYISFGWRHLLDRKQIVMFCCLLTLLCCPSVANGKHHNIKIALYSIMFTRKSTLLKKTGPDRIGRYEFLKQLIVEFTTTTSIEAKRQVLANLANFAYDPVNFEYLKQLHAIDLFLDQLSSDNEDFLRFGLSGLCNISPDPESQDYIIKLNGIKLIGNKLLHHNEEIALDAITALYYLLFPSFRHLITTEIIDKVKLYESHSDPRYKNLGVVFMEEANKNV